VILFLGLHHNFGSVFALWLLAILSTFVNILLALLIIPRLVYHQQHIRNLLGAGYGSPYSKVIMMCIESSALIIIFSGVYIILRSDGPGIVPFLLLPHICASDLKFYDF